MSPSGTASATKPRRFRVALSFPGEHRELVESVAVLLADKLGGKQILYDKWCEAEFARPNLDVYLPKLYHDQADLIVFFHCTAYNEKEWCGLEWRASRDLLKKKLDDRLMFLKLDPVEIDGLYSGDGYAWIKGRPADEVAKLILDRLALLTPPQPPPPTTAHHRSYTKKLPTTDATLIGRERELAILEKAWDSNTNIVQIIAPGGTGKTALMTKWYQDHREGKTPIFGWSFYKQGTGTNTNLGTDDFFQQAMDWFHLQPAANTADAKVDALVEHLRQNQALLILDGLEPLQNHTTGELNDYPLKDLLRELEVRNAGLVLCTTQVRLADVPEDAKRTVALELDNLSESDGARYLRERFQINGSDDDLLAASKAYGNHALALTLLGTYLRDRGGDLSKRFEIDQWGEDNKPGIHARRVMESYAKQFEGKPEGDILRALGFFDRPAERAALKLVLRKPLDEQALVRLEKARLILYEGPEKAVDCHPLVREHFGARTKAVDPEGFREGHSKLFDYFCKIAKEQPDTLKELEPLFHAVGHGCLAGRHEEARAKVYRDRIHRGEEAYLISKLGAFGTDLALLAYFFVQPWSQPISTLTAGDQSWVLSCAAFTLRALGRLADAVEPERAGAEDDVRRQDWQNAAVSYSNLSELLLTLGRTPEAIAVARQSVEFADRSGDAFLRMVSRTTLADALHHSAEPASGDAPAEAKTLFAEAERLQAELEPANPLYSLAGYRYCDLLLGDSSATADDVIRRATQTLPMSAKCSTPLLSIGLDHLTLGRAQATAGSPEESRGHLDEAVATLRRAGNASYLAQSLLFRGELQNRPEDLAEAHRIASRSGMRLILTDYHLAMARRERSLDHLEKAEKLIQETGYHRRDTEAAALRQELTK